MLGHTSAVFVETLIDIFYLCWMAWVGSWLISWLQLCEWGWPWHCCPAFYNYTAHKSHKLKEILCNKQTVFVPLWMNVTRNTPNIEIQANTDYEITFSTLWSITDDNLYDHFLFKSFTSLYLKFKCYYIHIFNIVYDSFI